MFLLYLIFHETFLPVKDTMNANFSIKKKNLMTIELHIIKQPIQYCFEDVICFSAQIYDNSLLMLKVRFQVFSFASKKVQGFSNDRKTLMLF